MPLLKPLWNTNGRKHGSLLELIQGVLEVSLFCLGMLLCKWAKPMNNWLLKRPTGELNGKTSCSEADGSQPTCHLRPKKEKLRDLCHSINPRNSLAVSLMCEVCFEDWPGHGAGGGGGIFTLACSPPCSMWVWLKIQELG